MHATTLSALFAHPSFQLLFLSILVTLANVMVGVSIFAKDNRKKGYRTHRLIYWLVIVCISLYLLSNYLLLENSIFDYFVLLYFLFIIPLSRKMDVTLHAVLSSIGLVLLLGVAAFGVF
ncbi:MAG: hypothetical protein COV66_11765 [Nitrospinae bacterium CG11_big_fil_rev_8_21_14_0_20_45_15]|nr:MAG: hypothetical protein COV66_11765 [Nitrospinae bacterium CG11_big_fil_rev_8_21_14_0_20_45_15]